MTTNLTSRQKKRLAKIEKLLMNDGRIIIAIDDAGMHFRETLCVHHNFTKKEVNYAAKPLLSIPVNKRLYRRLLQVAEKTAPLHREA